MPSWSESPGNCAFCFGSCAVELHNTLAARNATRRSEKAERLWVLICVFWPPICQRQFTPDVQDGRNEPAGGFFDLPTRERVPRICLPTRPVAPGYLKIGARATRLHRDADRNSDAWIPAVVHIVAVVSVIDVDIVVVVPVIRPVFRPWVEERNPITLVLEARESTIDHEGEIVDSEVML